MFRTNSKIFIFFIMLLVLQGCHYTIDSFPKDYDDVVVPARQKQSIFVLFDGTANNKKSNTNVFKTFKFLKEDKSNVSGDNSDVQVIWIEGVGASSLYLTGNALGRGMQQRISNGYKFISKHYNPGDDIYILGFSRGAHQARALAGMISYAGLMGDPFSTEKRYGVIARTVIEAVKNESDDNYQAYWENWERNSQPPLSADLKRKFNYKMVPAEIKFLGLWDVVPGSSFKKFNSGDSGISFTNANHPHQGCKEGSSQDSSSIKADRYKLNSYPTIKKIVHAVSLEEKRSKFRIVLVCKPINPTYTSVEQVWFPGAHADVGGGYKDDDTLSSLSLRWMLEKLTENDEHSSFSGYQFEKHTPLIDVHPLAKSHFSLGDFPANIGSKCIDRPAPSDLDLYTSAHFERIKKTDLEMRVNGKWVKKNYPSKCSDFE